MKHPKVSIDEIKASLDYDPETGIFTRKKSKSSDRWVGKRAGDVMKIGYRRIGIGHERIMEHHLAWAIMTGEWPVEPIDHKDLNPANNAWSNLRMGPHHFNLHNVRKHKTNTSGFKGAFWIKEKKRWHSRIKVKGEIKLLGMFDTAEEAHAAYAKAATELFGEFGRAV